MKILFSGYHNPHFATITEYMEGAIRSLGHELIVFDDRQHIIPGRVRWYIQWLYHYDLRRINRKIVSLAIQTKPDIAIVTGGHRIRSESVEMLKDSGIRTALWTIDAPLNFGPIINAAPHYDHIFCQGTEAVELLHISGITGAQWLPVACDPTVHKPVRLSSEDQRQYGNDVVFVGSYYPNRAELFEKLVDFDLGVWGPGWENLDKGSRLMGCIQGSHTAPSEWSKIYSAGKIVLATHYRDPGGRFPVYQASPRVFETLACEAFVISDDQRDVFSLFTEGEHLARYADRDDLIKKVAYYLDRPGERREIARRGRQEVLAHHTYVHRIERLLSIVSGG
jgi:spore maturation protein CgeB